MSDDLNDLKAMMDAATPRPDAARRAENLALAQKNFDDLQGSRATPRPTSASGHTDLRRGLETMKTIFTSKAFLGTTTALVAFGFVGLTLQNGPQELAEDVESNLLNVPIPAAPRVELDETRTIAPSGAESIAPEVSSVQQRRPLKSGPSDEAVKTADTVVGTEATLSPVPQAEAPIISSLDSNRSTLSDTVPSAPALTTAAPRPGHLADAQRPRTVNRSTGTEVFRSSEATSADFGRIVNEVAQTPRPSIETFPDAPPSDLKITSEEPVSTFSIDVDTAAYSVVRSSLTSGHLPPPQAVRIEEMINYFPYDYPAPDTGEGPFRPTVTTFKTPWNEDTQLVHIALQGEMPSVEDRPPLNLVFLIDTSGSMNRPNKLPLLKQSFRLMLSQLRPEDEVAIVAYAGSAGQVLAPTPAAERATILTALDRLNAGGGTNGQGGLQQAYAVADAMARDGEVNRVILATDGDFNVGLSDPEALKTFIADKRETGTYLSVLGFGRGNLDDATMQALAQNGNGTAAYIDTLSEAQKVLVDQLSGALFPIAGDVKVQVEFNPAQIAEYRLIGYETRALNREDFNNDKVDAGELGAGHSVTAIYEVTPVGSPAVLNDPLRYAPAEVAEVSGELGFVKLRYKAPGQGTSQLLSTPIIDSVAPGTEAQFAAAIAGFGQLLRDDSYLGDWGYAEAIALATKNRGVDSFGYRSEAVQLMRLADSLSR